MEHLVTGSRELARIDAGIETEERSPVDVGGLLSTIVEGYRLRAGAGPRVELGPAPGPLPVRGVPERLTAVFSRTSSTTRCPSRRGTARIALDPACRVGGRHRHRRGAGLPAGSEALIFSRFYSYRPGEEKSDDGHTGLGLALVKAIVEGYGGSVSAATRPDGGAVFTVRLPGA